jgi:hypothetical protein
MKTRFQILNFPQCFINPNLKKEIIGDINNRHDITFSYNGQVIISVREYGTGFGFGCRAEYIYLEMDKAKVLKSIGIDIEPISEKNYIAMNDEERKNFREIETQWYLINK